MSNRQLEENITGRDTDDTILKCSTPHPFVLSALRRAIVVLIIVVSVLSWGLLPAAAQDIGSAAEWHQVRRVLVHTPGEELFLGLVLPEASLFKKTFSLDQAIKEHKDYIQELYNQGAVEVTTVVEALLKDTEDPQSESRRELIELAKRMTKFDLSKLTEEEREKQKANIERTLREMEPSVLVNMILQQPTIILDKEREDLVADYELEPLMNMYFMRDSMITTAKGIVLGRMAKPQREKEREIIKVVLKKMGITPIYEISKDGRLEGGDYIPAGNLVFIGQGIRTNATAIKEMLKNDVFGATNVVVVKDSWQRQQEMHLDTFFNIIDSNLAVLVEDRNIPDCYGSEKCLKADVWKKQENGEYKLRSKDIDFVKLMEKLKFRIIPVSVSDQEAYGINFLTVSSKKIIGVDGVSDEYKRNLKQAGVEVTWIDFDNMKLGYGAAHCTHPGLISRAV